MILDIMISIMVCLKGEQFTAFQDINLYLAVLKLYIDGMSLAEVTALGNLYFHWSVGGSPKSKTCTVETYFV
jgi:hypothetical protein